jgi:mono/diheme cytochrome c family protein
MQRTLFACCASVALVVTMIASVLEAQDRGETTVTIWDSVYTAGQAQRGKATFDLNCSRCHNSDLTGSDRGPALVGDTFLSNWLDGSLEAVFNLVRDTMPQGNASTVNDDSKIDVLAYILQTNQLPAGTTTLPTDGAALDGIRVTRKGVWHGVYSEAQAGRGKTGYESHCGRCHGADLSGGTAPPLAGDAFIEHWETRSLGSLFTKIRDSMPTDATSALELDGKLDVVAYMLQRNSFPPGATDLTVDVAALDTVQILRKGAAPALPNFSFVQVVGCLEPGPGTRWVLTHSSTRPGTRERAVSAELERARVRPLGEDTYTLVSAAPFDPAAQQGHKVTAMGLLYRQPGDNRLNLTALETLADSCSTR